MVFLTIEAGKHASKSVVVENIIDKKESALKLFLEVKLVINSTTEFSIL